jgi:DNA polymerase-3 subunit alpha
VSGIVSSLQRKVTKQGDPWAIVNLEDHDAAVECLVFPKSYLLYSQALAEDQVLSVRGRINVRDETTSVYAEDITVLDVSSAATGGGVPVVLYLAESKVTARLVQDLKQILRAHPGPCPVHLHLRRERPGAKDVLYDLRWFQVEPEQAFYGDIKSLLGPHSVSRT